MILKDQLYTIKKKETNGDSATVSIVLNPECFIYKAHFPGNPITPGVCIVQTASELLGDITGSTLEISAAKDIKFLNILSPVQNTNVEFVFSGIEQDDDTIKAKVTVGKDGEVFATINFTCTKKQ